MKPRVSLPTLPARRSTSRRRRTHQRSETFRPVWRPTAWLGSVAGLLTLLAVGVVGWLFLSTPLWVVPAFAVVLVLPFVLTYLAVQFAGVLVALDESR